MKAAARTSAFLSVLFLVVYGLSGYLASLRTNVGSIAFDWERHIPFVPWLIVPYMSIDLFFVAAPFLCRTDVERRTLARRITFSILAAGAVFVLMPLRLAWRAPHVDGALGSVFAFLHSFDRPFNLVPSLHITLRTILADTYARHTQGARRVIVQVWFSLIGFSTVLTYQHHVVDVVAGFLLAAVVFHLFRETPSVAPATHAPRIALYYGIGAALVTGLALACGPWGVWLAWPAAALAVMASAYARSGARVFRKEDGRLPLGTRVVLAPVLFGHWLSWLHYRRRCRAWDELSPRVWIGRRLTEAEAAAARARGVAAVLDLTAESSEARPFIGAVYRNIPVLDLTAPTLAQLDEAVEFIHRHARHGVVYVHCKIGYSRSAAAVGAYLLRYGGYASVDDALAALRRVRPPLIVRPEVVEVLGRWRCREAEVSDSERRASSA